MTSPLIDENALMRRIESIERDLRELGPSIAQSFGTTVAALTAQQAALTAQQAALTATVADLTATQADLAAAQADIVAQQALIVTAQAVSDNNNSFAITTSYVAQASANLIVPTGFTKAVIQATATVRGLNDTGSADYIYGSVEIDGTPGVGSVITSVEDGAIASVSTTDSAVLTGLVDAQSIPVSALIKSFTAGFTSSLSNAAKINAFAIFYN